MANISCTDISANRLVSYDSSSSDEISDNNNDDDCIPTKKLKLINKVPQTPKEKMSLPASIVSMFEDKTHYDDITQHSGRKRTFPHEKGSWSSYVYLQLEELELVQQAAVCIHKYLTSSKAAPQFYVIDTDQNHISLSRTLPIPYHWIEPITQSLKKLSEQTGQLYVTFDGLQVYQNEDSSRTFIGLKICVGEHSLRKLVKQVDAILANYGLQKFYSNPSFHISLLWCIGTVDLHTMNKSLLHIWDKDIFHIVDNKYLLETLNFKSGYKKYNFLLSSV